MVKVKDLTDIGDDDYQARQDEYMVCQDCGETWGGTRGDYWHLQNDDIFECDECKSKNVALVQNITTIKVIKV